ncbi:MAG: DUF4169 family protein [Pseudomonadota bacterium]|nr:DUF4169 family protein [Pseudomonadota bacterium]
MGEIVNLRRVKKAKMRADAAAQAAENRARSSRTKIEREAQVRQTEHAARALDHARLVADED